MDRFGLLSRRDRLHERIDGGLLPDAEPSASRSSPSVPPGHLRCDRMVPVTYIGHSVSAAGFVDPNPVPNSEIASPGRAGKAPSVRLPGATTTPSARSAATWSPTNWKKA
jgi:hypothetical protein